jgi:hypothetical protein
MTKRKSSHPTFLELVSLEDAILTIDNDMCYVTYGPEDIFGYRTSESFNYSPFDLAFIFSDHLGISVESV